MTRVEHVLLAEAGMDEGSRFAVMVGVRIDDPSLITDRLTDGGDGGVVEVLRDVAFATRISFASKRQLGSEGRDWPFVLVANVVRYHWSPDRPRVRSSPTRAKEGRSMSSGAMPSSRTSLTVQFAFGPRSITATTGCC